MVKDLYSEGQIMPNVDSKNDYITSYYSNDTHVRFNSLRKLNTGDEQDYII